MRVLFSGAFHPRYAALPEGIVEGLRSAGVEVATFDHRRRMIPGRLRARAPALETWDAAWLNRRFLRRAVEVRPDLVLVNQGSVLKPHTLEAVRRATGAVLVNWWSDYPGEFFQGLDLARRGVYDLFYVSDRHACRRHRDAGAPGTRWLPFGCDPSRQFPDPSPSGTPGTPLVFVGSAYPERADLLRRVAPMGLHVQGPRWDAYGHDPQLGACVRGGEAGPEAWRRMYSLAAVSLNIHFGFGGPREDYGDMANVRVFEILACGGCQLVDAKADVLRLFRAGEELAVFRDSDSFVREARALLDAPEKRRTLAEAGRRAVLAGHTWRHRVRVILEDAQRFRHAEPRDRREARV